MTASVDRVPQASAELPVAAHNRAGCGTVGFPLRSDHREGSRCPPGGEEAVFDDLPAGDKIVEIWLSQEVPVALKTALEGDEACRQANDTRPRWVTYGSSLTHCGRAHSPARTYSAAIVGLVQIIRDKHPDTPMALVSPRASPRTRRCRMP